MIFRIAVMAHLGLLVSVVLNWALGWDWSILLLVFGYVGGGLIPILIAVFNQKS